MGLDKTERPRHGDASDLPVSQNHLRPDEGSGRVHSGWIGLWVVYFLDETVHLFLVAIKLCSVRHNRRSKENNPQP
jgi:hypothetical protein